MAIDIGPVAAELLAGHALNGAQRQADGAANVAEQTRLRDIQAATLIGAHAAAGLDVSPIAREVLQIRGTANQPSNETAPAK